jgi:small conductance mechanosensitive channel
MPLAFAAAPAVASAVAAHPAAPAAAPAPAVQPSLAEQLTAFGGMAWGRLTQLDAREIGVNLMVSAGIILFAVGVVWVLRRLFDYWLSRFSTACGPADAAPAETHPSKAAGVTWALLRLVVLGAALLFVIGVWGIDPWAWLADGAGAHLVRLTLIVVLGTALWEIAGYVIRRMIEGFAARSGDSRRAAQLRTLGPLLTGSVQGVLLVVGLITFLSELGVKVAPLLASAGVVGIAVGFGAQTLVKDFLTGLFLIAEDVVSVGDNVLIKDQGGTVEAMTLRTIRLRNTDGTLHIFPYSEAQVIHNRTKDFSSYLFEFVLNYAHDVDKALALLKEVGDGLARDPDYAAAITAPFEVLGVDKLQESGALLKAKLTTRPKEQWRVGREYNRRVLIAFAGAELGAPHTTVQVLPQPEPAAEAARPAEARSFQAPQGRTSA